MRVSVDALGYATSGHFDAQGNVLIQTRHATVLSDDVLTTLISTDTDSLLGAITPSADDRITEYQYDSLNRITEERRRNISFQVVDANNGDVKARGEQPDIADAITRFTFDGLGNTTSVIKTGEYRSGANTGHVAGQQESAQYTFDKLGRLIAQRGSSFADYAGRSVQEYSQMTYNALGLQQSTIRSGRHSDTNLTIHGVTDQVTRQIYNTQGNMIRKIDAENYVTDFRYDSNGNIRERIERRTQYQFNANIKCQQPQYRNKNCQSVL